MFQSALIGGVAGLFFMSLVSLRAQLQIVSGTYIDPTLKPTSIEGCDYAWDNSSYVTKMTSTVPPDTVDNVEQSDSKQLSFYYYSLFGMLITLVISNVASKFIERDDRPDIDPRLLAPMVRKLFANYTKKETEMKFVIHTFEHVNQNVDGPIEKTDG